LTVGQDADEVRYLDSAEVLKLRLNGIEATEVGADENPVGVKPEAS